MFEKKMISEFHLENNIIINNYIFIFNNEIQGGYMEAVSPDGYSIFIHCFLTIEDMLLDMRDNLEYIVNEYNNSFLDKQLDECGLSKSEIAHYTERLETIPREK